MIFGVFYRKMSAITKVFQGFAVVWLVLAGHAIAQERFAYALSMCDPVSYQVTKRPQQGREDVTLMWGGHVWAFANEGNRAAFEHAPEVYAPLFQGCAPLSIAQGYRAEGLAKVYLIYNQRLLLFQSRVNRALFLAAPDALLAKAQSRAREAKCGPYQ